LKLSTSIQLVSVSLITLILISMFTAFTAGIAVSTSNVGTQSYLATANSVKPSTCEGLNLTNIVSGTGTVTGTPGNDLILGGPDSDSIDGLGGDDCILGGGGDDTIDGNSGTDICLGGPGTDSFAGCEGEIQ
jgi:Ca2+-binding RTX toxin-like protein